MNKKAGYDYIVLGAGSAGSVIASRLSEDPTCRVLLVEAGGNGKSLFIRMPAGNGFLFGNSSFDWGYQTTPQKALNNRSLYLARGKALGGSSIMNGMISSHGSAKDYEDWARKGLDGWSYADLLPYFRKSEGSYRGEGRFHGGSGPLKLSLGGNFDTIDRLFLKACQQAGYPLNDDFNDTDQEGCGRVDTFVHDGKRMSAAASYIHPVEDRPNLTIMSNTQASRLQVTKGRATGVYLTSSNREKLVEAGREVIVCLGAYATPHLLMLSGIGPSEHLKTHGINVHEALEGVGSNLQDHVNIPVQFACNNPDLSFAKWQRLDRAILLGLDYLIRRKGPGASPFWSTCAFRSLPNSDRPDFQIFFTPMVIVEDLNKTNQNDIVKQPGFLDRMGAKVFARGKAAVSGFQFDMNLMRPESMGTIRLASSNPLDKPLIDPQLLSSDSEIALAIRGIREARDLAGQSALHNVSAGEISPGMENTSDADLEQKVRAIANTGQHPVSSCRMGEETDLSAVVGPDLKVHGIDSLRIMDASVFPTQICGNPNSPIIAMAERAADLIAGKAILPPDQPDRLAPEQRAGHTAT